MWCPEVLQPHADPKKQQEGGEGGSSPGQGSGKNKGKALKPGQSDPKCHTSSCRRRGGTHGSPQSCGTRGHTTPSRHIPIPKHVPTPLEYTHDPENTAAIPKNAANPSRDHPDPPTKSPGWRGGSAPKRRRVINQPNLGLNHFSFYYLFSKAKSQKSGSFRSPQKVRMKGQKGVIPPPNLPKKLWDGVPHGGWGQQHPVSCYNYSLT